MNKREYLEILGQYKSTHSESEEIKGLKLILTSLSDVALNSELSDEIVTRIKGILDTATSKDESTVNILQLLQIQIHPFDFKTPWKMIDLQARLDQSALDLPAFFRDFLSPSLDLITASRLARTCKAGKFVTQNTDSVIYQKTAARLLSFVMKGEQEQAEALLKRNPNLLDYECEATDYSNRRILTKPLKYAVWAGDWYMYQMLLKYISEQHANEQVNDLFSRGLGENGEYGSRFDFKPLFAAYQQCLEASKYNNYESKVATLWAAVYREQVKLPAHVIHQYMYPNRTFLIEHRDPPEFNETTLPRKSMLYDKTSVFSQNGEYVFGSNFGLIRGSNHAQGVRFCLRSNDVSQGLIIACGLAIDLPALTRLAEVIMKKHEQTFNKTLTYSDEAIATSSTSKNY